MADYPSAIKIFATVVNNVTRVLAEHVNERGDEITAIETWLFRALALGTHVDSQTLSGNLTLVDADKAIQKVDCNGSARDVTLPAVGTTNHIYYIVNVSAGAFAITVKNAGGTTIATVPQGAAAIILPSSAAWYAAGSSIPATTAANDFQVGSGAGAWIKKTLAETLVILGITATPTASKTPIADANGTLDSWVSGQNGFIRENSAQLLYVGAAAYSVLPGAAVVNGTKLTWAANIARTSLSLSANTLYYVYLYSNSGTPAVEESTTVPVWDSALNYYKKTSDDTRRCIGYISVDATPAIRLFTNVVQGRISEILFVNGDETGRIPVSAGTSPSGWTSFSLSTTVPAHATHANLLAKCILVTSGDDGVVGLSPTDLGSGIAANISPYYYRGRAGAANANVFFGSCLCVMVTAQTYYYRTLVVSGALAATVVVMGAKFVR